MSRSLTGLFAPGSPANRSSPTAGSRASSLTVDLRASKRDSTKGFLASKEGSTRAHSVASLVLQTAPTFTNVVLRVSVSSTFDTSVRLEAKGLTPEGGAGLPEVISAGTAALAAYLPSSTQPSPQTKGTLNIEGFEPIPFAIAHMRTHQTFVGAPGRRRGTVLRSEKWDWRGNGEKPTEGWAADLELVGAQLRVHLRGSSGGLGSLRWRQSIAVMVHQAMEALANGLIKTATTEACGGAFKAAFGRLLVAGALGHQEPSIMAEGLKGRWLTRTQVVQGIGLPALLDLTEGPCILVATFLGASDLCATDSTCRTLRELNRTHGGPWCMLGSRTFLGLELDGDGVFEPLEPHGEERTGASARKQARVDWKGRYARFQAEVPTFRDPFAGAEIIEVEQPDEIAYSRCTLRTDLLNSADANDIYMEIEVHSNPDNVSLAVVDFEAGGCSSVTFSPDTGAVIRERKVCEVPRKVQGAYIQPLTTITPGRGFEGSMGIFLSRGHLAFFRRHAASNEEGQEPEMGPWESTGFVTDLSWAEGRRLTPCLAFRNEGPYRVRMVSVCSKPPLTPERTIMAYDEASWSSLNWDADQEMGEVMGEV